MTQRIFTDEDRKAFAGLLPFAPGASVPFTPEAFESVDAGLRPVFQIRPYGKTEREMLANHARSGTLDKAAIANAMEAGAVPGWTNLLRLPDGEEAPYGKGVLIDLPDLVFYQLHAKIGELTYGPTKEEKEALTV